MAQPLSMIGTVMTKRANEVKASSLRIVQSCSATVVKEVAQDTPVDTGKARSNWITDVDKIPGYVIPAYAPYPKTHQDIYEYHANERKAGRTHAVALGRKDEQANLAGVIAQNFAAIRGFDVEKNDTVYIANNTPYIGRLNNEGYSTQTAPGFVQRAIEAGIASIRRMKLLAGN